MSGYAITVTPQNALSVGKAGEYLVCADLLLKGYIAFPSDQGLPYDVLVELDGRLLKVQVKCTSKVVNVAAKTRAPRLAYTFNPYLRGKLNKSRLTSAHCDIVALVALDIRTIAYISIEDAGSTVQLAPPGRPIHPNDGRALWPGDITSYTFEKAAAGSQKMKRGFRVECRNGHPWHPESTRINTRGHRTCLICEGNTHARAAAR